MCGIAGALSSRDVRVIVSRMSGAIAHRGPDDEGFAELTVFLAGYSRTEGLRFSICPWRVISRCGQPMEDSV